MDLFSIFDGPTKPDPSRVTVEDIRRAAIALGNDDLARVLKLADDYASVRRHRAIDRNFH